MSSPIPNLPPISGIQDPQVRAYLQALTNAWAVRNGQAGDGSERFLTVKDLQDGMRMAASGRGGTLGGSGTSITAPGVIAGLIQSLVDQVQQSRLWRLLGERIERIEMPDWFRDRFGAEITTERILRETATSTLANEITTITAAMGGSIAGVRKEVNVVANATNALAEETTQAITNVNNNIAVVEGKVQSVSDQASATASSVTTLQVQVGAAQSAANGAQATANSAAITAQQAFSLAQSVDGQVDGAWTVKFDANGYVTGAGLGISGKGGSYSSEFMVRADRFSIGSPVNPSAQWDADVPFIVTTTPTTVGGVTYPPGVWIKTSYIAQLHASKIIAGTIEADRIAANAIAVASQFYTYGNIVAIAPQDTTLTTTNSSVIGEFTVVNNSNANAKYVAVGVGRSGAPFGTTGSQAFSVFDAQGARYFDYGWTPAAQDAKAFGFVFTIGAGAAKTFRIHGAKTHATWIGYTMSVSVFGVNN